MRPRLTAILITSAVFGCSGPVPLAAPEDILIKNVVIVSPERAEPSPATDILLRGGRIAAIGPEVSGDAPSNIQVIDGSGRFLTPGLIDGHTHLSEIPGMTFEHEQKFRAIANAAHRQIPRSYLYHGFTTLIDLNGRQDYITDWNRKPISPNAFFCGASPVFDGYPMSWMPKPARYKIMPYFLYDAERADEFPKSANPEDHSPQAVIKRMRADGAICVKTHYERGFGGSGDLPVPGVELIRALVASAHEAGMPVLMHANSQSAQQFGIDAGADAFAHSMWTWNDRTATKLNPEVTDILIAVSDKNISTQPTIQVLYGERDLHDPDYLENPALRDVLPQSLLDWYETEDGQWWRNRMAGIPYIAAQIKSGRWEEIDGEPIARASATLSWLAENEGSLLFGSDTPSDPTFANPPGLNGRLEMDNWVAAGVTPATLFRAATIGNAEFFGLADDLGTIESGKRADLILMKENPMEDAAAYDTIEVVIIGGRAIDRAELSALRTND